jgi:glutathione S-transferase
MGAAQAKLMLWGRTTSINVMKVLWCLEELGLPYDREDVGGEFGRNHEPWYLAMNPNGRVPTIRDKGMVLWESNVVVRYLSSTYGAGKLLPADSTARWHAEQWMDWQQTVLAPAIMPVFQNLVRRKPAERDMAAVEKSRNATAAAMAMVEARLGKSAYIAGPAFSMGDIPIGPGIHRWLNLPIERPATPNIQRYYQALKERPAYRKHIALPLV